MQTISEIVPIGKLVTSFDMQVPTDYNRFKYIDTVIRKHKGPGDFFFLSTSLTSENFAKITDNGLEPGATYWAEFFLMQEKKTWKECYDFLIAKKALHLGPHGPALLLDSYVKEVPTNVRILSFYEDSFLFTGNIAMFPQIPYLEVFSDSAFAPNGKYGFGLQSVFKETTMVESRFSPNEFIVDQNNPSNFLLPDKCLLCVTKKRNQS